MALMTLKETAEFFRVSVRTIEKWIKEEDFPVDRTSAHGRIRVREDKALAWWDKKQERQLAERLSIPWDIWLHCQEIVNKAAERRRSK